MRTIARSRRLFAVIATVVAVPLLAATAAHADDLVALPPQPEGVAWPTTQWPEAALDPGVDRAALSNAVETAFRAVGRGGVPDTRALLLIHHSSIVFERYADGFGGGSRFHSWSMAKSFTQALIGMLIGRGTLELDAPAPVPAWQDEGDPRREITLRHLLHMTAGMRNDDATGGEGADAFIAQLLFGEGSRNTAAYAMSQPPVHPPGTHWSYSTATTAIVAEIFGRSVGSDTDSRSQFIRTSLFDPIGMGSAVFGFDKAENLLGGSHLFATARDYARFGLLYLRDGVWDGKRLLPDGWVDFSRTRAPALNNGVYGAHFWLNLEPKKDQFKMLPGGPSSAFAANGNSGQSIIMVPTHDLVMVRLGELQSTTWLEMNQYLADIVAAFPSRDPDRGGDR